MNASQKLRMTNFATATATATATSNNFEGRCGKSRLSRVPRQVEAAIALAAPEQRQVAAGHLLVFSSSPSPPPFVGVDALKRTRLVSC